ncbi:MAG: ATP-binding protein [Bdellovibrionota bacterium]
MKPANEGLSAKEFAHLKSAIDEAAIVAITDKKGTITYVNKKFCTISQYSREELIGSTHRIINSKHHPPEFFINMWATITSGQVWEGEVQNRAKDGSYYWVHTTIVPFLDSTGKPEQYVAVRYEITERKLAEEKLIVYAKKLEVSNRELQDFASVAAHDLQEPLRKIQAFSDRLRTKAIDELNDESKDYLDRIQNSANRMQTLINDLLTYSRVTTQAQPFKMVALQDTVRDVVADLEAQLERSKGQVEVGELLSLEADPTQLRQLLQNLISNALKFQKPGVPPLVKVSARKLQKSPLGAPGVAAEITIEDNGIGFDEKYLDRIFTIFQRLHGKHEYEGTGIGLAVCRKIVDRHGGTLSATSELGKGSTFIVTLPLKHKQGVLHD